LDKERSDVAREAGDRTPEGAIINPARPTIQSKKAHPKGGPFCFVPFVALYWFFEARFDKTRPKERFRRRSKAEAPAGWAFFILGAQLSPSKAAQGLTLPAAARLCFSRRPYLSGTRLQPLQKTTRNAPGAIAQFRAARESLLSFARSPPGRT